MIYGTADPHNWKLLHKIQGVNIKHIVTDMDTSPSEKLFVYSTLNSHAHLLDRDTINHKVVNNN